MRAIAGSLVMACLGGLGATASPVLAQQAIHETEQADFRVVTVAGGLEHPWSMAFLPGGDMLVSEREGRLRYIEDGVLRDAPVAGIPDVFSVEQGGLLGIELHPEFETNRLVYLAFAEGQSSSNRTALARGRLSEDGTALEGVEMLFRVSPDKDRGYHFGGRIAFLPDGTLLLSLGDGGLFRNEAQDLGNHLGTIVRLNEDGTVPFDNPFVSARGAQPEIWSYGHRNVQGLSINPQTGSVWALEHGPRGGDEINIITAGDNYGWPVISYGVNYDGTPVSADTHHEGMEQPIWFWDPSVSPSGLAFYAGDGFPDWQGDAFIGALSGTMLIRFETDGDRIQSEEALLERLGERIRDVAAGPDGFLYLLTDADDGRLIRLEPVIP